MTDLDDLLGGGPPAPPAKRRPGRPTLVEIRAREAAAKALLPPPPPDLPSAEETRRPVGIQYLSRICGMDPVTVKNRLLPCPVLEWTQGKGAAFDRKVPLFNFMEAMSYLIDPKIDLERYLLSLSSSTNAHKIPVNLNKGFWDAMNAKAKWEENARHTWHDEDVLAVLGETAIMIREVSLLWVENLPGRTNISNEDYHALRASVTDLLEQIKDKLVTLPAKRRTESVVSTMRDNLAAAGDNTLQAGLIGEDLLAD